MIRVAIIGTGGVASWHATELSKIKGCRVVAACDVDENRARTFADKHGIPNVHGSVDSLLEKGEFDAVTNATPDRFHAPVSIRAMEAGKHVFCEKPLALNYAEAARMARIAKRTGVINMVNFTYRNAPAIQKAAQLVAEGALGEIVHVEASYLQSWLSSRAWGDWRESSSFLWKLSTEHGSRGVLCDLGVHLVDFASFPVGKIKSVTATLKTFSSVKGRRMAGYLLDANDTAMLCLEFSNGALATLHTTRWAAGHLNTVQLRIFGSNGGLRIDLDQGWDKLEVSLGADIDKAEWRSIPCPPVANLFERFIRSIRTGRNEQPDFRRGAEIQKVLDACFVADVQRQPVRVG